MSAPDFARESISPNFFFCDSAEEKIRTTIADPILQKNAMTEAAAAAAKAGPKDCKSLTVINTEILPKTSEPLEGSKGPPWSELRTLALCATKAEATMHFVPDKTGAAVQTNSSETKILGR